VKFLVDAICGLPVARDVEGRYRRRQRQLGLANSPAGITANSDRTES